MAVRLRRSRNEGRGDERDQRVVPDDDLRSAGGCPKLSVEDMEQGFTYYTTSFMSDGCR
jgi:hypothetical protein